MIKYNYGVKMSLNEENVFGDTTSVYNVQHVPDKTLNPGLLQPVLHPHLFQLPVQDADLLT